MRSISTVLAAMVLAPVPANAKPKLGPDAVPIHAYLQSAPAVDCWAFSPFDKPQFTSSACSIASVTMAFNGLRGLPAKAAQKVPTQQAVLKKVGNKAWQSLSAEGGDGVTDKQLPRYTVQTMAAAPTAWTRPSRRSTPSAPMPPPSPRPARYSPATRPAPTTWHSSTSTRGPAHR